MATGDYLFPELAADAETQSKNAREVAELTAKRQARASDSETCKIAAKSQVLSGRNATNLAKTENALASLLHDLNREPTAHEVFERINDPNIDAVETQRRLSQLVREGRVQSDKKKHMRCECSKCRYNFRGALMMTWRLT